MRFISEDKWVYAMDVKGARAGLNPVSLNGGKIIIIGLAERFYAVSDKCAHMGCSLSKGSLDGFVLKCPCHDWRYDIRNGVFIDAEEIKLPTYDVKKENNKIYVKLRRME